MTDNTIQHNIVRSVEINLRMTLNTMPDELVSDLVTRIQQWADSARNVVSVPPPATLEVDYTLQIKHLADHLIRSFHPTPF